MDRAANNRDPLMALDRLKHLANDLLAWVWRRTLAVEQGAWADLPAAPAYGELTPPAGAEFKPVTFPMTWPGRNRYGWLKLAIRCPEWPTAQGPLYIKGQVCDGRWNALWPQAIVLLDGRPIGGLDAAHHVFRLADGPRAGQVFELSVLAWTGMQAEPGPCQPFELAQLDSAGEAFATEFDTVVQTAAALDREDYRRYGLIDAATKSASLIDLSRPVGDGFFDSLPQAHAALREGLAKMDLPKDRPVVSVAGHGHLDLGWLWPVQASHFKTLNTVVNQLALIDELKDHVFVWSQPQCWKWMQKDHRPTWERFRKEARAGHFEASGAMWVESDTNLPAGESLIRQLMYGTRFCREHLGHEETLLWLPDVFGYTAALPQLLRQFDVPYFMTTKISWNEYNRFPWETFFWEGLDGSRVLTHFGSVRSGQDDYIQYGGDPTPRLVLDGWKFYQAKNFTKRFLVAFGPSDGGGGATRKQVQACQRMARMPGLPEVKFQSPRQFFAELAAEAEIKPFPTWAGELYFEFHRGTYTTEARVKRGNRACERALHDAELLAALALPLGGRWDKPAFDDCWELLLLNQFHDILPGSSIHMVYEQAAKDHASIVEKANGLRDAAAAVIASKIDTSAAASPVVLFNTLGTRRTDPVELPADLPAAGADSAALRFADGTVEPIQAASDPDGRSYRLANQRGIDGAGWMVADVVSGKSEVPSPRPSPGGGGGELVATENRLENDFWRIELDGKGRIASLFDKKAGRPVLAEAEGADRKNRPGPLGNQLQLFRDRPFVCQAWDITYADVQETIGLLEADKVEVIERGPVRAAVRCHYAFGQSKLVQDIRIYRSIERIDFSTWVDWHEQDLLLKAAFPVAVRSPEATFEIQFGAIARPTHRNTSWDVARFEVPAQRWIDLSEGGPGGYGVSLLNDCKYGHDVLGSVMRISLLRGAARPEGDGLTDQGEHRFTYSLLPHRGDWRGRTIAAAAELNLPAFAAAAAPHAGNRPAEFGLVSADQPNFVISAIKKAEDDDRVIIRGYEAHGSRGEVTVRFGDAVKSAWKSRADERVEQPLKVEANAVKFAVRPFEVVTLKVQRAG